MTLGTLQRRVSRGQQGRTLGNRVERVREHVVLLDTTSPPSWLNSGTPRVNPCQVCECKIVLVLGGRAGDKTLKKPSREFSDNLNTCGPGGPLCSQSICPVRFTFLVLDLLGQLKYSLWFSATPPVWRKWHKQWVLSSWKEFVCCFHCCTFKKNVFNGTPSSTWRRGELNQ